VLKLLANDLSELQNVFRVYCNICVSNNPIKGIKQKVQESYAENFKHGSRGTFLEQQKLMFSGFRYSFNLNLHAEICVK